MGKRFSKRTTRKTKVRLNPNYLQNIIEKEFTDSKGNKSIIRFDFNPHPISEPSIQLDYKYGEK